MKPIYSKVSPFFLVFFIPVAILALILGVVNFSAFSSLNQYQYDANAEEAKDIQRITATAKFSRELSIIQKQVNLTLEQAAARKLDEAQVYFIHSDLVNHFSELAKQLEYLKSTASKTEKISAASDDFTAYQHLIIGATDLAAIDPPNAMREAYQASQYYVALSEHLHIAAEAIAASTEQRSAQQANNFYKRATETIASNIILIVALIGVWFAVVRWLTNRLSVITNTLQALAEGNTQPPQIDQVHRIGADQRSALSPIANAVTVFQQSLIAQYATQADLKERMKEISCLYEVFRVSENPALSTEEILHEVCKLLPAAMHFPEQAEAHIRLNDLDIGDPAVSQQPQKLSVAFKADKNSHCEINIAYLRAIPIQSGDVFLKEEYELLGAISSRLSSVFMDRHSQAAERDAQELMNAIIQNSPYAIELIDTETLRFVQVNQASSAILGYSREALLDMTLLDIQGHFTPAAFRQHIDHVISSGNGHYENVRKTKQGKLIDIEVEVRTVHQRGHSYLVNIWSDITAKKAAEAQVRLLSQVVEQNTQSIVITDLNKNIVYVNQAFTTITGYSREEANGRNPGFLSSGKTPAHTYEDLRNTLRDGKTWTGEFVNRRKNGEEWIEHSIIIPIRNVEGQLLNYVAIKEDITEKKRAQNELDSHRNHLEQLVADRTAEVVAAKEVAEAATRVKSDFLANMSHEIRTPMNAIIGLSHLVLKTEMTPKQQEYLKKIQTSSQHLLGIINDILDFSKIEAGKLSVEKIDFDLEHVLSNVSELIHDKASDKGLEIIFDVAPDVPTLLVGDPLRVGQVLINFATNAIKFTEQGEVAVIIRKEKETDDEIELKFSVRDTGIGLTEEQAGKLFQSFQQADTSTTRKYGGTGLGLVICKRLSELMGGKVGLHSTLGKGSEFWFTAKLGKAEKQQKSLLPDPDLRGKRVLVVDDNENARTVMSDLLGSMSFVVDSVSSGVEALNVIQQSSFLGRPYEMIFMDWQMPNMDGIETTKLIRQLHLSLQPKIHLVTAFGREEVFRSATEANIDEVLLKPVSASTLFDSVVRAFRAGGDLPLRRSAVGATQALPDLSEIAGAKILVVEDNEINQEIAKELLEDAGFVVDIAIHGREALNKVQQHSYDIVLMDMQMPEMDGITATKEIRKLPNFSDLPIVAMTANAMQQDRDACLAAGMNDHIPKPIDPNHLWLTLLKWTKKQSAANPSRPLQQQEEVSLLLPAHIDGVDTQLGLSRVMGKQKLYLSLLEKFISSQEDVIQTIQSALASQDIPTAERLAHSLKGVSGNIGATDLQQLAGTLEATIRNREDNNHINTALAEVSQQLTRVITALRNALPTPPPAATSVAVDEKQLATVVTELITLLQDNDMSAIHGLENHAALLQSAFPKEFKQISQAIKNFDFDTASEALSSAAKARGLST